MIAEQKYRDVNGRNIPVPTPCHVLTIDKRTKKKVVCGYSTLFMCNNCNRFACFEHGHIAGYWRDGKPVDLCNDCV